LGLAGQMEEVFELNKTYAEVFELNKTYAEKITPEAWENRSRFSKILEAALVPLRSLL
jgi:hypothetical protein